MRVYLVHKGRHFICRIRTLSKHKWNATGLGKLSLSKFWPNLDGGEYDPTVGWNSFGNQYYFLNLPNLAEGTNRLKSISGCGGQVINSYYVTAKLTSGCTITAVFVPSS
jgi:hypothetical protein